MIRIRNRAMARMPGVEKWRSGFRNGVLFSVLAAGAAVLAGITGPGYVTVLAADNMEQNQVMAGDDSLRLTGGGTSGDADDINIPDSQTDNTGQVYDFKNNKTTGTVTVTKVWDDGLTNEEREIPDIKISTAKPGKNPLGYTITFHGNGLKFADGSEENIVIYNSAGEIVQGEYKMAVGNNVTWCRKPDGGGTVEISSDGILSVPMTEDIDLWAKEKTFEIKGYKGSPTYKNGFNQSIPSTVTEVIFTDEIKPASAEVIDVDADGDDGVIAWTENNGTVMKVSTQIKGIKVQAAVDSQSMFSSKSKIKKIDLKMLDTSNVTDMSSMFSFCFDLTSLDLTPLDTANVTDMSSMFYNCTDLTSLDLTPLDTSKVTSMGDMFSGCYGFTSLDLTPLDTTNVTDMRDMFSGCSGLTTIDLSPLNTANVTSMHSMFYGCRGLTSLDLTPLDTSNVTDMGDIFNGCSGLINLDLSLLDTTNVTSMRSMFYNCRGLTSLDLTPLDTSNVTSMGNMFFGCRGLTSLDLTPLDTTKVTSMDSMFYDCSGLTTIDLFPLNTAKVTSMRCMFSGCRGLINLDLSPLDTANVTDMVDMFNGCSGLTTIDLSPLNTANVTNMYSMFYGCSGLTTLKTGPSFKFVGTGYYLGGTWQNTAGETFNGNNGTANFPSNVADTYTKISD